ETPLTDATRWLIHERGHRRFGFITVEDDVPIGPRRFAGLKRAGYDGRVSVEAGYSRFEAEAHAALAVMRAAAG
nr:hypothetical protein [Anaerolinea sp.]